MIDVIKAELLQFADQFQEAGKDGFKRVKAEPYNGDQWDIRRLQRNAYLHGLYKTLPATLGTFILDADLYPQNRLLYHSVKHDADLIFRRRGSINAFSKVKSTPTQESLFDINQSQQKIYSTRQIACIWDLPRYDKDYRVIGDYPFRIQIAKPNTVLSDEDWESGFTLYPSNASDLIPQKAQFDQDAPDWDIDNQEEEG